MTIELKSSSIRFIDIREPKQNVHGIKFFVFERNEAGVMKKKYYFVPFENIEYIQDDVNHIFISNE